MKCIRCGESTKQNKRGKTSSNTQRYFCMHCRKSYSLNPKQNEYSQDFRLKAIKLYLEGNSSRAVGRILGIGKNMVIYWLRKYAKTLQNKNHSNERVEVIEMDELYCFTQRKNRIYLIKLVERKTRRIVGYDIAYDKGVDRI